MIFRLKNQLYDNETELGTYNRELQIHGHLPCVYDTVVIILRSQRGTIYLELRFSVTIALV